MYLYPLHFPIENNYSALHWTTFLLFFLFFWHLRSMTRVDFGQRMWFDIQGRHEDESSLPSLLLQYWLFNSANCCSSSSTSAAAAQDSEPPRILSLFLHCLWRKRILPSPNRCVCPSHQSLLGLIKQIAGVSAFRRVPLPLPPLLQVTLPRTQSAARVSI